MLTAGTVTYGYDNNGNLITKTLGSDVTEYSWDFNNMLTQVVNGTYTYGYEYDGLENRISRTENSVEKRYLPGMLGESDSSGN
jgi:YD repeat-containing protein